MNNLSKQEVQELLLTSKDGWDSTGNADLDYALYNFFQSDNGIQSTNEAVLVANEHMLNKYHNVNGDVQLKFLKDIFYSFLPYCEEHNDYDAVQQINTKLLQTLNK
jgi:hypothetical protein